MGRGLFWVEDSLLTNRYPLVDTVQTTTNPAGGILNRVITTTVGAATAAAETVARPYSFNVTANRQSGLTAVINPITEDPSIYSAYIKFLDAGHDNKEPEKNSTLKVTEEDTTTGVPVVDQFGHNVQLKGPDPKNPKNTIPLHDKYGNPVWATTSQTTTYRAVSSPETKLKIRYFGPDVLTVKCSKTPPSADEHYIKNTLRLWEGDYYWIPTNYEADFAELWLAIVGRAAPGGGGPSSANTKAIKALQLQNLNSTNQTLGIF